MSEEIVKQEQVDIVKFTEFTNVKEQLDYANLLIESKLVPFKTAEQVVMIANLGRSLGVSFDVACQNINSIQNKPALSVHLMAALAKKGGIDWEIVKDGERTIKEGKVVDITTEITFYRYNDRLKKVISNTMTYSWSDAVAAGYTTKD